MDALKVISVITPLWNEEEVVDELAGRLKKIFQDPSVTWEWVAVDDGSSDRTVEKVTALQQEFSAARLVLLSRNFGQQSAYRAGIDHARGDAVIFLDADMQDPPELIPELVSKWMEGARLVVGCRRTRKEKGLRGGLMAVFHEIFFRMTGGAMPKNSGTFGLADRVIIENLKLLPEKNLFLPALRHWIGFRKEIIWYDRMERKGAPKQTYAKLFRYAWDGITSFSDLPLQLISALGAFICLGGLLYAVGLVLVKLGQFFGLFSTLEVQGFTTLAVAIMALGGIQLFCLGVLGEYLARIYREVKSRPHYIAAEVIESPRKP